MRNVNQPNGLRLWTGQGCRNWTSGIIYKNNDPMKLQFGKILISFHRFEAEFRNHREMEVEGTQPYSCAYLSNEM